MKSRSASSSMLFQKMFVMLQRFPKALIILVFTLLLSKTDLIQTQPAIADEGGSGNVYAMTNSAAGNKVMAYRRNSDGSLNLLGAFATNGIGSGPGIIGPSDPLGAQGSLVLHEKWLFAVNAGSDEISVFQIQSNGLKFIEKVSSQGKFPVSLAVKDDLLYVLNSLGDANGLGSIVGFEIEDNGHLSLRSNTIRTLNSADASTPIVQASPNSLQQPNILDSPSQISFSPKGDQLIITDKGVLANQGLIHVFNLNRDGVPSATPVNTVTTDPGPFGFTFDRQGRLVVTGVVNGGITTFNLNSNGTVTAPIQVSNNQGLFSLTCWIARTQNGRYFYVTNNATNNISAFEAGAQGHLSLLQGSNFPIPTGANSNPSDVTISGRFLYSVSSGIGAINMFQINQDGSLTSLGNFINDSPLQGAAGLTSR